MIEIWKDIEGYENLYQVSNLGRIRTVERKVIFGNNVRIVKSILRKPKIKPNGYLCIIIYSTAKQKTFYIHRLVSTAFIPNVENLPQVNHKDGNRQNNVYTNLEWCSSSENHTHAYNVLNRPCYSKGRFGEKSNRSKPIIQYSLSGEFIRNFSCAAEAQRKLGFHESGIRKCLYGKTKQAYGFKWKYDEDKLKEIKKLKGIK